MLRNNEGVVARVLTFFQSILILFQLLHKIAPEREHQCSLEESFPDRSCNGNGSNKVLLCRGFMDNSFCAKTDGNDEPTDTAGDTRTNVMDMLVQVNTKFILIVIFLKKTTQ